MNGSEYKKMVENFNASDELKQSTINVAHCRAHIKLKITKREKIARYSSIASVFAIVIVLCIIFNVGESVAITANALRNQNSGSNGMGSNDMGLKQTSSEKTSEKSTEKTTEKSTELSTEKMITKATETSTEKQTTKVLEAVTTAPIVADANVVSSMQLWNGAKTYTNAWSAMTPINTATYNFSGSSGSIDVKTLSSSDKGTLFEAKVGASDNFTIRMEVHPKLFNTGLVVTKTSDGIVTFTNDTEGIILCDNVVSYPKLASESQSVYAARCISYLTECCTDTAKAQQGFSLNGYYTFNTKSAIVMTNSDTEWRACMKLNYTGNPIATLSGTSYGGFGYLTVVFEKSTQCFVVQTYVAQRIVTNEIGTEMSNASYGLKYKVN